MYRMIDANINRICEGLRVIEDFLRFELNDGAYIARLKEIRHFLRENIPENIRSELIQNRDSIDDKGKAPDKAEKNRSAELDLVKANFYRAEEGLRVLEECFKLIKDLGHLTDKIKEFRFEIYDTEKKVLLILKKQNPDN